jgi:uncharacterized membrane protein YgaE (UPF0421/DUF939 family)
MWKKIQTILKEKIKQKMKKNWNKHLKNMKKTHLKLYQESGVSSNELPPTHGKKRGKYHTN